ncbi:serine/threonine-protein kinase [Aeromicrobium sp. CF4.19]|uniref:serine/threonine-protein kinase n=1 Tax=Aeromicrobium sp. CF4.19 TaxID=3373082 RepID=UPI003EE53795
MTPKTIADRYVVDRAIGHGGMGTVWLCRDDALGRSVAVKEVGSMPGASTSDLARALREARSSAALNHPNVVAIYDAVEDGGHHWLVMEYVPSRTLSELVAQEGALSPERVARIGAQAADGLSAAHERGTVHRDVKPGNILVLDDDRVKITDFGIARTHGDAQLTRSGIVTGTPAYFAPELAQGAEPTEAADVWALGASLYAAVEGRLPYPDKSNAIAMLTQIASEPPPDPARASFLAEPIARMMDRDPLTRWTMADVAHTLHRLHDQHAESSGPGTVAFVSPFAEPTGPRAAPEPAERVDDGPATEMTALPTQATATPTQEAERVPAPAPAPPPGPAPGPEARPAAAAHTEDRTGRPGRGGRRLAVAAVILALVALVPAGAFLLDNRDRGGETAAEPGSTAPQAEEENPAAAPDPEQFVEDYYALLPSDTEAGWALLSPRLQGDVGGYDVYTGFWATISEVRVDGTRPAGDGLLDVDLTYTGDRGTESETRRLRIEEREDGFLIVGDRPV